MADNHGCDDGWLPADETAGTVRAMLRLGRYPGLREVVANSVRPCPICRPGLTERLAHRRYQGRRRRRSPKA